MDLKTTVHPEKWRDTIDLFALRYKRFKPLRILCYPHARNDVFHVLGDYGGEKITAYIKVARREDAAIENEVDALRNLKGDIFPKVLDYDEDNFTFLVTKELEGQRLSTVVADNENLQSRSFMEEYGEALSKIHSLKNFTKPQADRVYRHAPEPTLLKQLDLSHLEDFFNEKPKSQTTVFCHGDFHYANILWKDDKIGGVLDFELCGLGNRDFDIAWSIFLRPGQKFLKTDAERKAFLKGYSKYNDYDEYAVKYYTAACYVRFLKNKEKDSEYYRFVINWLNENVGV